MAGFAPTAADRRIAARAHAARKAAGLTQRQVASALGVSGAQIQKYESGDNRISAGTIQALAELFGVPVSDLFDARPVGLSEAA